MDLGQRISHGVQEVLVGIQDFSVEIELDHRLRLADRIDLAGVVGAVQLLLGHVAGDLDHPGRLAVAIQYWIVGSLDPDRSSVLGDPLILGRLELAAAEPRPELLVVGTVPVGRLDEQAVMLALNFVEGVAQD